MVGDIWGSGTMTDRLWAIMHFPQVERTFCSGFPYAGPNFQEKSPFTPEPRSASVSSTQTLIPRKCKNV